MSNFKSIHSTVQGKNSSFSAFQPIIPSSRPSQSQEPVNSTNQNSSNQSRQLSDNQKLQQELDILRQQNQVLQSQLEEARSRASDLEQQFQGKERQLVEQMQYYREVMLSIQDAHESTSRDIKENFLHFLKGILDGIFTSQRIMDVALYASLATIFQDLQDEEVVVYVQSEQVDVVKTFIQEVGIQRWVIQVDKKIDAGGFRVESQLSHWLQSPQQSIEQIIVKLEERLNA